MAEDKNSGMRPAGRPAIKYTEFKIGDVFPADDPASVAVVRFLVVAQSLLGIGKLHTFLPDEDPVLRDARDLLMFQSIGLLRETAKAFQDLEDEGVVKKIEQELLGQDKETQRDLATRIDRLRTELAWNNLSSLLRTFLKEARDAVAFHFGPDKARDPLKDALVASANETIPSVVELRDTAEEVALAGEITIPLVNGIRMVILESIAGSPDKLNAYMSLVASLQGDVFHVAHFLYGMWVSSAGVKMKPSGAA